MTLTKHLDPPMKNYLFSSYYLKSILNREKFYRDLKKNKKLSDFIKFCKQLYQIEKKNLSKYNESQLEENWIKKILQQLKHTYQVQMVLDNIDKNSIRRPDYVFFINEIKKNESVAKRNLDQESGAYLVGDAKAWNVNLNSKQKEDGTSFNDLAPAFQICNYIQITKLDWGLITNGKKWRLYSKFNGFQLKCYIEMDLEAIILLDNTPNWNLFYLIFNADSFKSRKFELPIIELIRQGSENYTIGLKDEIYEEAFKSLKNLCQGFLDIPKNCLTKDDLPIIHNNSLIFLYRIFFIFYAESRGILPIDSDLYLENYSLKKVREDIKVLTTPPVSVTYLYWTRLNLLFELIDGVDPSVNSALNVPRYNGGLFSKKKHLFIEKNLVGDNALVSAIKIISQDPTGNLVDYSELGIKHLGGIYEHLLEFKPRIEDERFFLVSIDSKKKWVSETDFNKIFDSIEILETAEAGSVFLEYSPVDRKNSGSYYTPSEIVHYINARSLKGWEDHIKDDLYKKMGLKADITDYFIQHLLNLRILDFSMGSGHFLRDFAVQLTSRFVELTPVLFKSLIVKDGEEIYNFWLKYVIENCIYGVDINPMAVELSKLSLWLELSSSKHTLAFLDANLKYGNSLIGLSLKDLLDSFNNETNIELIKSVLEETKRQLTTFKENIDNLDLFNDTKMKEQKYLNNNKKRLKIIECADYLVAKRFGLEETIDLDKIFMDNTYYTEHYIVFQKSVEYLSNLFVYKPFHWELEFPEIFLSTNPKFDIIIGNPPYIKARDNSTPEFRNYLEQEISGFKSLSGMWDMYIPFLERGLKLLKNSGFLSMIIPNTIGSADYTEKIIELIDNQSHLVQIDFYPKIQIFPKIGVKNKIIFIENECSNNPTLRYIHDPFISNFALLPPSSDGNYELGRQKYLIMKTEIILDTSNTFFLEDICIITFGLRLNSDKGDPNKFKKVDLLNDRYSSIYKRIFTDGKALRPYNIAWKKFLEWGTSRSPSKLVRPTFPELYEPPKLLMGRQKQVIAYSDERIIVDNTIVIGILAKDLENVDNNNLRKYYLNLIKKENPVSKTSPIKDSDLINQRKRKRKSIEKNSRDFNILYLMAILNSSLMRYYILHKKEGRIDFYPNDWKEIPIKKINLTEQNSFIVKINKIIKILGELFSFRDRTALYIYEDFKMGNERHRILEQWHNKKWRDIKPILTKTYKKLIFKKKGSKVNVMPTEMEEKWLNYFEDKKNEYENKVQEILNLYHQIDEDVFNLYNLKAEEIKIVYDTLANKKMDSRFYLEL